MAELEGVIRYNSTYLPGTSVEGCQAEELLACWHLAREYGWIGEDDSGVGYGNLSQRDPHAPTTFLITGTQTSHYKTLTAEKLSHVLECDIHGNRVVCSGPVQASSETLTHAAVYNADESVHFVLHIHNRYLWHKLQVDHPITAENLCYGTPELALAVTRLVQKVPPLNAIVMLGHENGIVVYSKNSDELIEWMQTNRTSELSTTR
jgi:hypothetical protein